MDFSLTKEQKEYISEVRKFAVENLNGNDEKDFFSESMWKLTSDFGCWNNYRRRVRRYG